MTSWVEIDGAFGEGGGQILRAALSLSLITGRAMRVEGIRANRPKPGLRSQHLAAVRAAAMVAPGTEVQGAELGSTEVVFQPAELRAGRYTIDIGTAGNSSLVLQTIALPLAWSQGRSRVRITGGTHVPWSPCFEFVRYVWAPAMEDLGLMLQLSLERAGFYPKGGGCISADINPAGESIRPLQRCDRPKLKRLRLYSHQTSDLSPGKARRQSDGFHVRIKRHRRLVGELIDVERREGRFEFVGSSGTAFCAVGKTQDGVIGFQQLGARDRRAEHIGEAAADALLAFLRTGAAVDPHTADQILLPLALAGGDSAFTTSELTSHLTTLIHVIGLFVDVTIEVDEGTPVTVRVRPAR